MGDSVLDKQFFWLLFLGKGRFLYLLFVILNPNTRKIRTQAFRRTREFCR